MSMRTLPNVYQSSQSSGKDTKPFPQKQKAIQESHLGIQHSLIQISILSKQLNDEALLKLLFLLLSSLLSLGLLVIFVIHSIQNNSLGTDCVFRLEISNQF